MVKIAFLIIIITSYSFANCQRAKISGAVATTDSFFALIGSNLRGTAVGLTNGENPCLKNPYCGGECKAVYQAPALHDTSGSCWLGTAQQFHHDMRGEGGSRITSKSKQGAHIHQPTSSCITFNPYILFYMYIFIFSNHASSTVEHVWGIIVNNES